VNNRRKISQPIPIRIDNAIGTTGFLGLIVAYSFIRIYSGFGAGITTSLITEWFA